MEVQTSVLWTLHMNISYLRTDAILRRNLKIGKRPGESTQSLLFIGRWVSLSSNLLIIYFT